MLGVPALGTQRQVDPWDSLARQPSLIGKVLVGKTPISRNKRLGVVVPFILALWRQREETL